MKLHLKQHEITAAITMYLADQGIRVANKNIDVSFTAGRKNSGLSADVSIEDAINPAPTIEEVLAYETTAGIRPDLVICDDTEAQKAEVTEVQESDFPNAATELLSTMPVDIPVPIKTSSLFS